MRAPRISSSGSVSRITIIIVPMVLVLLGILVFLPAFLKKNDSRPAGLLPLLPRQSQSLFPLSDTCADPPCPAEILDLANWKVTLPITAGNGSKRPLEIRQPELAAYRLDPWFMPSADKKGVVFRAPINAPTTGDSDYPRSELREMSADGKTEIHWPSTRGTHTLFLDQAITAVPKTKQHVVAGQIHGDDDDLLVIRLEYPVLSVTRSKKNVYTLDEHYTLGKRFTIRFVASGGQIKVYYNGSDTPVYTLDKKLDEAYFKAGAYVQSNCEAEDSPSLCTADNYGEVTIYRAAVTHE